MSATGFPKRVSTQGIPRRSRLFLDAFNNFPIIVGLPLLAVILGLNLGIFPMLVLSALTLGLTLLFWKSSGLDLRVAEEGHPHHAQWTKMSNLLRWEAAVLKDLNPWISTLIFWLAATAVNFMTLYLEGPNYLLGQFWLLYIPVIIWIGHKVKKSPWAWFGIAWTISALVYLLAFSKAISLRSGWSVVGSLLSNLVWFLFLSIFLYILFRHLTILRSQSEFLQDILQELRQERGYSQAFDARPITSRPDEHLNQIAHRIGSKLKYERVYIHIRDAEKEQLFMKGRYGADQSPWPADGWAIQGNPSITGWVAQNKQAHLCRDTCRCVLFFKDDPVTNCRSEATVPIIVEDNVVGLIDVESDYRGAFNPSDVQVLSQIADSIGAALAYERHASSEVEKAYDLIEESAQKMVSARNLDEALEQIAEQAGTIFGADLVTLYKHAVATKVPLPGLIYKGKAYFPQLLGNSLPDNARVNELLGQKEEFYIQPFTDEDALLLGPNQGVYTSEEAAVMGHPYRFVKREGIKSTIYLKLGLGQEVVGSLFLNYRRHTMFQKSQINALRAFAKTLAMALILKRQVERACGPLAGAIPLAHSQAEAAFEYASRVFKEIHLEELDRFPECRVIQSQLMEFSQKLERLKREWNNLILVEQSNLHGSSLAEPITSLESKLRVMFPEVRMKWNFQEFVCIPTDELGEVIYKIVAESVSNALLHAKASLIELKSTQDDKRITLSIFNNGIPIDAGRAMLINNMTINPQSQDCMDKSTGIVPILLDARRWFGADWKFTLGETSGTLITVRFPLGKKISPLEEENQDENEI